MHKPNYHFIDVKIPDFDSEFFDLWLQKPLLDHKKELGELNFIFSSDEYLLNLNKEHLNHDYYTDVITFNYNERNSVNGDVFISWGRVQENAVEFSSGDEMKELKRVMVHGLLHLLGYNDKTSDECKVMREMENKYLEMDVSRET